MKDFEPPKILHFLEKDHPLHPGLHLAPSPLSPSYSFCLAPLLCPMPLYCQPLAHWQIPILLPGLLWSQPKGIVQKILTVNVVMIFQIVTLGLCSEISGTALLGKIAWEFTFQMHWARVWVLVRPKLNSLIFQNYFSLNHKMIFEQLHSAEVAICEVHVSNLS